MVDDVRELPGGDPAGDPLDGGEQVDQGDDRRPFGQHGATVTVRRRSTPTRRRGGASPCS